MKLLVIAATIGASASATAVLARWTLRGTSRRSTLSGLIWLGLYLVCIALRPEPVILAGLVGLVAASLVGSAVGRWIPSVESLTVFLVVASVVDILSWFRGPTRALLEEARTGGEGLLPYLAVTVPWQGGLLPVIGIADIFGFAVVITSLRLQEVSWSEAFLVSLGAVAVAVGAGISLGGVPAFPFIAAIVIPFAWTSRRLEDARGSD